MKTSAKLSLFILLFLANRACSQGTDTTILRTYQLGEVSIIGYKDSSYFNKVSSSDIKLYNRTDIAQALNLLPGLTLSAVGPRNESMVNVRGFDLKQVPVYLDGIPVYVPYDGYIDLARFTTFDLAGIQVAKGYSSVLYGPNAEGGAINLISRKPVNSLEFNSSVGWYSGGYRLHGGIGSRFKKLYYQADISQIKRDNYPLSASFTPTLNEDGDKRNNSYSNDSKVSGKIGFIPDNNNEFVLGYAYQNGSKGNPLYTGSDRLNSLFANPRFWKWPEWDKQDVYMITNHTINSDNSIKTRWYWDQFKNRLDSYDNANYTSQSKGYAFSSIYDDYTFGNSVTFQNTSLKNNSFSVAGHFKQDVHRENNVGEPNRRNADNNFTLGAENTYDFSEKLSMNIGLSYLLRKSLATQQYNSAKKSIYDLPSNSSDAFNLQGLVQYSFSSDAALSFSIARKTRFATIKDRYSFKMGTAVPNPDLKSETAVNYDLSYRSVLGQVFSLYAASFYSKIDNSIQMVANIQRDPVTNVYLSQIQNIGNAEYYGLETGLVYDLNRELQLNANYSHIVRNNLSNPNILFTDVPKNKVFISAKYDPFKQLYLLLSTEYNSSRYSTNYGTLAKGFGITNAKINVKLTSNLSIETGANNLFNKNYQLVEGFPQAGRNFFSTLLYDY